MIHTPLIQIFGEVLFDCFPDGSRVLGGAPFNVAWHLQAFGLAPQLISRVGDDQDGQTIAALMADWGMSRATLQTDRTHPTGQVQVEIRDREPHYDIVANSAYDFIDASLLPQVLPQVLPQRKSNEMSDDILYHGSLALRNPIALTALQTLKTHHQGKIFLDVNLRDPWWQKATLLPLLDDATWVKLNEHELAVLWPTNSGLEAAMQDFCQQFGLDILIVTRGAQGAIVCQQQQLIAVEPAAITEVVDTVGAGDAFTSVFLLGLIHQWPIATTLQRAQDFASAVVQRQGATIADRSFYQTLSQSWT